MPMTPIQARQALQQRGLPLTAENLNRMMAASYGMDDVPLPDGSASEGPMIDTSIADDDEQRSAAPMTPPTPPRRGADVVSSNPTPQAPPPVQPPPVNAAVPAPPAAVDNISPDDPADAGSGNGLSMTSAPAQNTDNSRPELKLSSPPTVTPPSDANSYELGNADSMPSPMDALLGSMAIDPRGDVTDRQARSLGGTVLNAQFPTLPGLVEQTISGARNIGVSRPDPVAGPDQGFAQSPAQMLMQQIMRMFQNQPQTPQQSPAMGGPPRRN